MSHHHSLYRRAIDNKWPIEKRKFFIRQLLGDLLNSTNNRNKMEYDNWLEYFGYSLCIDDEGIKITANNIYSYFKHKPAQQVDAPEPASPAR